MRHIFATTVNEALHHGLMHLHHFSIEEPSRNGPVLVSRSPVITTFSSPRRRVLVNDKRDANPFFHLFEALWMLAGRNDLAFPQKFVSTFGAFSDDGLSLHGAYGFRWRNYFGYDQIGMIVDELRANPKTRRTVLSMWDGGAIVDKAELRYRLGDLHVAQNGGKDVPCNTHIYFDTIGGKLNMTTVARGLDMVLGAYGANAVHMSILHEYVAAMVGLELGVFRQFANNFHAYTELYPHLPFTKDALPALAKAVLSTDPYFALDNKTSTLTGNVKSLPVPLIEPGEEDYFHADLDAFMLCVDKHDTGIGARSRFFQAAVNPMWKVWRAWKEGAFGDARQLSLHIEADDWRLAAQDWLSIREKRRMEKKA